MIDSDKKQLLILCFSNLKRDPRVYRQISFLKESPDYILTAAGWKDPEIENVKFCSISSPPKAFTTRALNVIYLKSKQFEQYYWSSYPVQDALKQLENTKFDLIIANDLNTLPLALKLASKHKSKVLLDAHEYQPRLLDDRLLFRFFFQEYWDYICRQYLPHVDGMITVCPGIAKEYNKVYGVQCDVLTNAPFYELLNPSPVDATSIRMIQHGAINKSRKMEKMILLMDLLDERFTLDFMVIPNDLDYLQKLKQLAKSRTRVSFRNPVPMPEIAKTINEYDIGLYLLAPDGFNKRMALPNKLFEFIQARLAVAIWPSPEMARVVEETKCGVVAKEFTIEAMAKALNNLSAEDIQKLKHNSHQAASTLCAETNRKLLLENVQKLIA